MILMPLASVAVPSMTSWVPTIASHAARVKRIGVISERLMVNLTSSAVKSVPSCHLTPWRSLNVQTVPSGEIVQDSAMSGRAVHVRPSADHSRSIRLLNMSSKLTYWLNVSYAAGCQMQVQSPSQCIWSVSFAEPPVDGAVVAGADVGAVVAATEGAVVAATDGAVVAATDGAVVAATDGAVVAAVEGAGVAAPLEQAPTISTITANRANDRTRIKEPLLLQRPQA